MYLIAKKFWPDLDEYGLLDKDLNQTFTTVKNIPYQEDLLNEEIARPGYLLDRDMYPALDCKKKAVILGAWAEAHGIPWKLVGTSEQPDRAIHHIFPQFEIDGEWVNVDATYPEFVLFEGKKYTTEAEEFF